ncbi:NmrA family NAD(P)-binding protein [Persicitalea jodogahamensis]|uniref:NmrA family transcriptional regulator n=1 Tax=Persicitalea jodogahamensis TaxID=402147 RepID=A0A8J3GC67_9BACT|nr:NmrA family NAD(P)-binding protein [Persicitalea jodogahamensis]GHB86418.1 NmrA family transcriptional regulator [Persicitalea jodogahamensis]
MHVILGATGHVGSAVAQSLLDQNESVTVLTRDPKKSSEWERKGATVAVVDVRDVEALRNVFKKGKRFFVLNPPAPPSTDTALEERKNAASILEALQGSGIEKVVVESTYGARPGDKIGDLGVLYELEIGLAETGIPTSVIRAAYYMSNWDISLPTAQRDGEVRTFFPLDMKLPMASPSDLGKMGAKLLMEPVGETGLYYVEGPQRYSSADVAAAFESALGRPVKAVQTPREQWTTALKSAGFSPEGADSMAAMTEITIEMIEGKSELPSAPERGETSLKSYIGALVATGSKN